MSFKLLLVVGIFSGVLISGCEQFSFSTDIPPDPAFSHGSPEEKRAVQLVQNLAVKHGYNPKKMNWQIIPNSESGNFSIFLFPKPVDLNHLRRNEALFAIVQAKTGKVIEFSDPGQDKRTLEHQP